MTMPCLMEEAMKLAHDLANGPTIALSLIRKLYWDSPENSFEEQLNLEFEIAAHRGRGGRFQGRRHRVPRKAPGQVQGQMIEDELGRCVASWYPGATGVDWRRKTFRRRQPGDLDVRHRARRAAMIGAILRRAPPGYGASPGRAAGSMPRRC